MNLKYLQIYFALYFCVNCVYTNHVCDSTLIDETAKNSCDDLIAKRSITDWKSLGYKVEHHKHSEHKRTIRLTHRKFPSEHYLLVHPKRRVNSSPEYSTSNEMGNEISTNDNHHSKPYPNKFKRNTLPDDEHWEYDICCHPGKCSAARCT